MTFREAYGTIQSLLANFTAEPKDTTCYRLMKAATMRFASETGVTVKALDIAATGARDYTLAQVRAGRIWRAEHNVTNMAYPIRGVTPDEMDSIDQATNTSGTPICYYFRFARTLRVWPASSAGTITLYHAPTPVLANRDSVTTVGETATGGTSVTAAVSALSHGVVANRQGVTDYFNGCRVTFITGALTSQTSFITSANEGVSAVTFTFAPAFSSAVLSGDTFKIEDVLEVPDEFAPACVNYAAGMIAGMDSKAKQVAGFLLDDFNRMFQEARRRGFAGEPGTQLRMKDQSEVATSWPRYPW